MCVCVCVCPGFGTGLPWRWWKHWRLTHLWAAWSTWRMERFSWLLTERQSLSTMPLGDFTYPRSEQEMYIWFLWPPGYYFLSDFVIMWLHIPAWTRSRMWRPQLPLTQPPSTQTRTSLLLVEKTSSSTNLTTALWKNWVSAKLFLKTLDHRVWSHSGFWKVVALLLRQDTSYEEELFSG